jgi:hypothetical protein
MKWNWKRYLEGGGAGEEGGGAGSQGGGREHHEGGRGGAAIRRWPQLQRTHDQRLQSPGNSEVRRGDWGEACG